ncbi:MAG: SPL family radical SAM protein [Acidobacteriota bacterium]
MPRLVGIAKLAAEGDLLEAKKAVEYFDLPTRKLLNRTTERMPFAWTINPYRGCEFGCKYCYARYTHEFMELRRSRDFEEKIFAKRFAAAALRAELQKIDRKEGIAIGTATDPYQPAERRYGLTREILTVFARENGRRLSITTKSDLVARDIGLMKTIAKANVLHINLTITTVDEKLARLLEPRAPRPALRLDALRRITEAGIHAGVFANPVMPFLTDTEESLDAVAQAAKAAGATYFGGGLLFLKPCSRQVFLPFLDKHFPELVDQYERLYGNNAFLRGPYAETIKDRVRKIRARHNLAGAPIDYTPELWHPEPEQGTLW